MTTATTRPEAGPTGAERFRRLRTAWISDAQGSVGVMDAAIKTRTPGKVAAGPAFTVRCYPGSIITVHKALAEAKSGDMLIVAGEADDRGALLGELMAGACRVIGLAGVVIDGAIRDAAALLEIGFPVYARSVTPRVGSNRRVGQTQVPVACGGAVVHPGDWVLADDDGVVVVPAANAGAVLAAAELFEAKEGKIAERIGAGEPTIDVLGMRELVYPPK